jgi:hypothetical protein
VSAPDQLGDCCRNEYRETNNIASALPRCNQGAITIPMGFFECFGMLIIPRNSLKFRLLVDSNLTHRKDCNSEGTASRKGD